VPRRLDLLNAKIHLSSRPKTEPSSWTSTDIILKFVNKSIIILKFVNKSITVYYDI